MGKFYSREEMESWLRGHGWHPGRDVTDAMENLISTRLSSASESSHPLTLSPAAKNFLCNFGLLELSYPGAPEISWIVDPTIGYQDDTEDFAELASLLGSGIFPVGGETSEGGIMLMDEKGRVFYAHHTGDYFIGNDVFSAFAKRLQGGILQEAREFYV